MSVKCKKCSIASWQECPGSPLFGHRLGGQKIDFEEGDTGHQVVLANPSACLYSWSGALQGQGLKSLFPEYAVPEKGSPERKAMETGWVYAVIGIGLGKVLAGISVSL